MRPTVPSEPAQLPIDSTTYAHTPTAIRVWRPKERHGGDLELMAESERACGMPKNLEFERLSSPPNRFREAPWPPGCGKQLPRIDLHQLRSGEQRNYKEMTSQRVARLILSVYAGQITGTGNASQLP